MSTSFPSMEPAGFGIQAPAAPVQAAPAATPPQPFSFTGSGSEYFRIWIVNLLLTIVTIGIYSAWAKVRRTKYFYNNTHVAGSNFEYHGNPISILKGRLIAFGLLAVYQGVAHFSPVAALVVFIGLAAVMPWLLWKSLQFKLFNTSYRSVRFGFKGTAGGAYKAFLLWPILSVFTLYLLWPFAHHQLKKFQHTNSRFGATDFSFRNCFSGFYANYLVGLGLMIVAGVVFALIFGASMMGAMSASSDAKAAIGIGAVIGIFALYAAMLSVAPVVMAMLQNTVWNNTSLGPHQFSCAVPVGRMVFVTLTNLLGIVCTLGLFIPFAAVRMARVKIPAVTLVPSGSLEHFMADTQQSAGTTGEGMADLLDFDISM
jgi:uncharacterized membrane protein YjgN (DUF898 family)